MALLNCFVNKKYKNGKKKFGVVRCCCARLCVVVNIDCVLIFVGDGHGISQAASRLQCRIRARVWDLLSCGALFVGIVYFSLEVHAFHGVDSLFVFLFFVCLIDCHSVA